LLAHEDARLLYVTSQPQFHLFSENLQQLRQMAVDVELKDGYTAQHCERLQELSFATGQVLGLEADRLFILDFGAYFHDLGKIRVPLHILNKPGSLDAEEWAIIKRHPTLGKEILDTSYLKGAGRIVEQHHERIDGSGYPFGLGENEVMVESSIVAVADAYDAMTTDRTYRKALSQDEAFAEIHKYAGIHYPKEVVKAFIAAVRHVESKKP
jgi:HD-GYP domain-containing protein (c-di-GMP phosphodiesterase class II)